MSLGNGTGLGSKAAVVRTREPSTLDSPHLCGAFTTVKDGHGRKLRDAPTERAITHSDREVRRVPIPVQRAEFEDLPPLWRGRRRSAKTTSPDCTDYCGHEFGMLSL
jgi:hypothetical protein